MFCGARPREMCFVPAKAPAAELLGIPHVRVRLDPSIVMGVATAPSNTINPTRCCGHGSRHNGNRHRTPGNPINVKSANRGHFTLKGEQLKTQTQMRGPIRQTLACLIKQRQIPVTLPEIKKIRTTDTVYILGSGPSITAITHWDKVIRHDSIGFNGSIFLPVAPTMYFLEHFTCDKYPRWCRRFEEISDEYRRSTSVFIKWHSRIRETSTALGSVGLQHRVFSYSKVRASSEADLVALTASARKDLPRSYPWFRQAGSLDVLIFLAWTMGYENIVLCGVDLNSSRRFFDDDPRHSYVEPDFTETENLEINTPHTTDDSKKVMGGIRVRRVLEIYQEHLLAGDAEIFVENSQSSLATSFQVWPLRDTLDL